MKIGVLFEGKYDQPILRIINRILNSHYNKSTLIDFTSQPSDGDIEGSLEPTIYLFFTIEHCDLVVFVADKGKKSSQKDKSIKKKTKKLLQSIYPNGKLVFAFPEPEFEQWYLDEEDAVKKLLGLNFSSPLPHNEIKEPKERLEKIIDECEKEIDETKMDIYLKLARNIDLNKLSLCSPSFKKFRSDLTRNI